MTKTRILTKSLFSCGLQNNAFLWRSANDPKSLPSPSGQALQRMQDGQEIGKLAQKLFPDGIGAPFMDYALNLNRTKELLLKRQIIFEAGFESNGFAARTDVLVPVGKDEWDILEVKATSEVKDEHIYDVGFQKFVCEKAGLKIRSCSIVFLNKDYVRHGELDIKSLLKTQLVDFEVSDKAREIDTKAHQFLNVIMFEECPPFEIEELLTTDDSCPVAKEFYDALPSESVFDIPRGKKKAVDLYTQGIHLMKDIPSNFKLTPTQSAPVEVAKLGKTRCNVTEIKKFLSKVTYPIYYFDFEAFNKAVPIYDGMKPYQQIPFQYSLHIEAEDGKLYHKEFLHNSSSDPRLPLLQHLIEDIGTKGTIIVYNQTFEQTVLKNLAESFPQNTEKIQLIISRLYDLMIPFKDFAYYDAKQCGSFSIKKVLPLFSEQSHKSLAISDGGMALSEYMRIYLKGEDAKDVDSVRKSLLKYCELDTLAMQIIFNALKFTISTQGKS